MTDCLEIGSHLCHGCVTDASRPSPGETPLSIPRPPLVPGRRPAYPPSRTAPQPLPARLCMTRCAAYRLSGPVPNLSGAVAFRRLPVGWTILERMIDRRPQASRILVAQLTGEAKHHARWRDLTADEEAAAVAALRELGRGRADLLAEVAGVLEGASEGELDEPLARQAAGLCRAAGADPEAIPAWIEEGRRRRAAADMPPFSGGLHGGGRGLPQKSRASHGIASVAFPQDGRPGTAENALLAAIEQSARTRGSHEPASGSYRSCTCSTILASLVAGAWLSVPRWGRKP